MSENLTSSKSPDAFRTISEVAEDLGVQQHVLRFWETKFSAIKPLKRGGGRRYYRPEDVALIKKIHNLLYTEGYTIKGVQKLLKGVSKSAVLAELRDLEKNLSSHTFGENLPEIQGVGLPAEIPVSSVKLTKIILSDAQKNALRDVLKDLQEMRGLLKTFEEDSDLQKAS